MQQDVLAGACRLGEGLERADPNGWDCVGKGERFDSRDPGADPGIAARPGDDDERAERGPSGQELIDGLEQAPWSAGPVAAGDHNRPAAFALDSEGEG
jgi:hypothetical protein